MKTGQQSVDYIDLYISYRLERPELYAIDAQDLESILWTLDDIRQYAVADGNDIRHTRSRYANYLGEQGFGVKRFMTDKRPARPFITEEVLQEFREFTDFWGGYLTWRDRT